MEGKQAALPPPLAISFSHGLLLLTTLTMPKFNAPKVYAEELRYFSGEWLGYPLWCPEPENGEEVQIGDVGLIFEGRFRSFFNIFTEPAEDGTKFHYNMSKGVDNRVCLDPGTHASTTVKIIKGKAVVSADGPMSIGSAGLECEFESSSRRGAVLHLKDHADSTKVISTGKWVEYVKEHSHRWAPTLEEKYGIILSPKNIVVVTGFVKSSHWAVSAFEGKKSALKTRLQAGFNFGHGGFEFKVSQARGLHRSHLSGPKHVGKKPQRRNQCIFINTLEVGSWLSRLRGGAGSEDESDNEDSQDSCNSDTPESTLSDLETETDDEDFLPCAQLRKYILECSEAEVAIADDRDLELLLGPNLAISKTNHPFGAHVVTLNNVANYLRKEKIPIEVDENSVGTLSKIALLHHAQVRREKERWQILQTQGITAPQRWDELSVEKEHNYHGIPVMNGLKMPLVLELAPRPSMRNAYGPSLWVSCLPEGPRSESKAILPEGPRSKSKLGQQGPTGQTFRWYDILFNIKHDTDPYFSSSFSISNDGEHIVTFGTADGTTLWNCRTGHHIRRIADSSNTTALGRRRFAAFSPKGAGPSHITGIVAVAMKDTKFVTPRSSESIVTMWTIGNQEVATFDGSKASLVAYSPDGRTIAAALGHDLYMWSLNGTLLRTLQYPDYTSVLTYSPNGKLLLVAGLRTAYLMNCESGDQNIKLQVPTGIIRTAQFSHKGDWVVTTQSYESTSTAYIWDVHTGAELTRIQDESTKINEVDISQNDRFVIVGTDKGWYTVAVEQIARTWEIALKQDFEQEDNPQADFKRVRSVAFSHDGRFIASGGDGCRVCVWTADEGELLMEFRGHEKPVTSVVWTPDDKAVISSSMDGTVRSWSVYDARRLL